MEAADTGTFRHLVFVRDYWDLRRGDGERGGMRLQSSKLKLLQGSKRFRPHPFAVCTSLQNLTSQPSKG